MIPSRILGLTSVLYILEHQLPQSLLYRHPRHCKTVDDLLIHIVNFLGTGSPRVLALGVSGSSSSIMDLTLTVVAHEESKTDLAHVTHSRCLPSSPHPWLTMNGVDDTVDAQRTAIPTYPSIIPLTIRLFKCCLLLISISNRWTTGKSLLYIGPH